MTPGTVLAALVALALAAGLIITAHALGAAGPVTPDRRVAVRIALASMAVGTVMTSLLAAYVIAAVTS